MLSVSELQTPDIEKWVRHIARSVYQEQIRDVVQEQIEEVYDEVGVSGTMRLRRDFTAHQAHAEQRFGRLENALLELAQAEERLDSRFEDLTQAQQRTEERVAELTQAQQRTEERVAELTQAQQLTEERVAELTQAQQRTEERVAELTQAQQRTEERVAELTQTQQHLVERVDNLDHRVGLIGNVLGIEAEGEAEETLVYILQQDGYQLLENPYALAVNGVEVDLVVAAKTSAGERVSVLVDVKARARLKELRRWASRLQDTAFQAQLVEAGIEKPFLPYFFGLRVYQIVDQEAERLGIGVVDPNGERVKPTLIR